MNELDFEVIELSIARAAHVFYFPNAKAALQIELRCNSLLSAAWLSLFVILVVVVAQVREAFAGSTMTSATRKPAFSPMPTDASCLEV